MLHPPLEAAHSARSEASSGFAALGRPVFGLTSKVLAPITVLTLLAAVLAGLILREEYNSYQTNLSQKKSEFAWHVRTLYESNRSKLLDVAELLAKNTNVQNGLLIGDQDTPLNIIMGFLGHSNIEIINLYDLDGRAFARAQSPSYFGDYDELAPLVRESVGSSRDNTPKVISGIVSYKGKLALVAMRITEGVSGATGVVAVGQFVSERFLESFVPANHTRIALTQNGGTVPSIDFGGTPNAASSIVIVEEREINGDNVYKIELQTDDPALFSPFWGARASILLIAALAAIGSVIVTFIFMFVTVVKPVRHLIAVAEQQVSGDLTARVGLRSRDELGRLGDILNLLTGNLKATLENQDRINEQLEARVKQRTGELQCELSERENAQSALVRAKEEAEAANASKSRFLAAASHDLRQPVHAMTLFVSNLSQQVETPKAKRTVANINACVESLCEMFEKILDVSKLASGVIQPQIEEFPIDRLLSRLQREFEGLATDKGIELQTVRSSLILRSDPTLLYRILCNFVSNALKNTKQGRVLIGCRRREQSVEIQIWDTGVGIPQSEIVHVFEEFYRGASRVRQKNGGGFGAGLGLGLSIVEHTAKLLNHSLDVSSTPNKHTRFSIRLPRASSTATKPLENNHGDLSLDVAGHRILVVDDDILALRAVQSTLEDWGCIVDAAQSPEEAFAILANNEPPVVLVVDYLLQKGETGLNLLSMVEARLGLRLPAIVLSGVSSRLLEQEAERGGHTLLYKPAQPARLRQALAQAVAVSTVGASRRLDVGIGD